MALAAERTPCSDCCPMSHPYISQTAASCVYRMPNTHHVRCGLAGYRQQQTAPGPLWRHSGLHTLVYLLCTCCWLS